MERPSSASRAIYRDLPEQSRRLDARGPRYRFDIESDVRWDLLDADGLHVVPSMVDDAGIDRAGLRSNPEAESLFDWAYGLAVCRVFVALEEVILDFERRAGPALAATKSLAMLCEDEVKHKDLFRRYARHLERRRPERMAAFERAFAQTARGLASVGEGLLPPESPAGHYVFWVNTLLFEELTVYYHERLGRPPEDALVQPAWRSVHAAHRVEELQHLVTDEHYLEALDLGPEARDELSEMTALLVVKQFNTTLFPFAAPLALVEELHPALPRLRSPVPTTRAPLFREVITGPCLKRTRRNAPAVDRLGTPSCEPSSLEPSTPQCAVPGRLSSQPGNGPATLVALLRAQARQIGQKRLAVFLGEEGFDGPELDREGLDRRARALAVRLGREGLRRGDRALLIYPPGLDFLVGFFGCLYAGVTAVPVCPPAPPFERTVPRLDAIAARSAPGAVLSDAATIGLLRAHLGERAWAPAPSCWMGSDETPAELAEAWRDPAVGPETPAFLQFTSGSTAAPKGVVVTHENVLANQRMIREVFRIPESAVFASWLPPFHDMGLVGSLMQPIWVGGEVLLLSPVTFLARPRRWLEVITHFRVQVSPAPNFAFDLCVRRIPPEAREGLDLSSWERAPCGAEPVRARTMDAFIDAFGPHGFREAAFTPCYGLAEATLLVSGRHGTGRARRLRVDRGALERGLLERAHGPGAAEIVSSGAPPAALDVRIVLPSSGQECAEGRIGEVWVRGASITAGYHEDAEATLATYSAELPDGTGPFLRTGDLGVFCDGELFICGRIKDLIIVRGRNFAPEDIEALVSRAHGAVRPGGVAAFSLDTGGEERLALVVEVRESMGGDDADIIGSIREEIGRVFRLSPYVVALARAGSIPKTSSGKIQRSACRTAYLSGSLHVLARKEAKEIA